MKINKHNHKQVKIKLSTLKDVGSLFNPRVFKEQVDKLKFVQLANYFCIENKHYFYIFGECKIRDSPESLSKMQLWGPKHHTKGVDLWKLRRAALIFWLLYINIYICIYRLYI